MSSSPISRPSYRIALHLLIWLLLLLFPFLLSNTDSFDLGRFLKFTFMPMVWYALLFYLNLFYLVDKLLIKRKIALFVACNLALMILFTWLNFEMRELLNTIMDFKPDPARRMGLPPRRYFIYKDVVSMMVPIIASIAVKTTENWAKAEDERKEREKEMLNWELQHLKYQLQPHFFFNSLNTVYALIERSPALAQETVHNLSKLMRYLLYDTDAGKVRLSEEISFMSQYVNLMKLRISDKTHVRTEFPEQADSIVITPLLFISLIENAFKHGISATQPSEINFRLIPAANKLTFIATNTNFPKTEKDKSGSGIGLINLRKRIELSYPGRHHFEAGVQGSLFVATLEIQTS